MSLDIVSHLIDGTIILFLVITIAYAVVLNRKLAVLRDARGEMEELIKNFSQATRQAGEGLGGLKDTADGTGQRLSDSIEAANRLADDLAYLVKRGEMVANRLERGTSAAKTADSRTPEPRIGEPRIHETQESEPAVSPPRHGVGLAFRREESDDVRGVGRGVGMSELLAKVKERGRREAQRDFDLGPEGDFDDSSEAQAPSRSAEETALLKALQGMR